ncbi:ankyrin repeat protein, partial [Fusarium avenaceum]
PLTLMTAKRKSSIVQLLLKHGAPVNTEIQNIGGTALHMVARLGTFDIAKTLLDFHAKIDQQDGSGSTPLHLATLYASVHFVDLLLDHGEDPKLTDNEGCTSIHRAAANG